MISLVTYVDADVMEKAENAKTKRVLFEVAPANVSDDERVRRYSVLSKGSE